MKTILLMLLSLVLLSCGARKTETEKQTEKTNENIKASKSGESNLKLSRDFVTSEKQVTGKMQLSIIANMDSSKNNMDTSNPCANQRKVIVKDSQGNSAEMMLNANEDINFNNETNVSEKWQKYTESLQEYYKAKENFSKTLETYKQSKIKKTESDRYDPWMIAMLLVIVYVAGMITLPLIRLFIESKMEVRL